MPLTESEQGEILFYLGYPAHTMIVGNISYSRTVMDRFKGIPDHLIVRAKKVMGRIKQIDDLLEASASRFALKKASDIELNENESDMLVKERKRLILQLSGLMDIAVMRNYNSSMNIGITR